MTGEDKIIKKESTLSKFDSQKKKDLLVRGFKELVSEKTVLYIDKEEGLGLLIAEEFQDIFGDKIKIVFYESPTDAFEYLISNKVDLIIADLIFFWHIDSLKTIDAMTSAMEAAHQKGIDFLRACKMLYRELPFIIFTAVPNYKHNSGTWASDAYVVKSTDLSELIKIVEKLLKYNRNTEEYNCKLRAKDIKSLTDLGLSYIELKRYSEAIEVYRQVIKIEPNYPDAHYGLGLAYLQNGQKQKTLEEYQILKRINFEWSKKLLDLIYSK